MKTGNLICFVGSSTSVVYFPREVTVDDATTYPIEFGALPNPTFENGVPCSPQQGAGFVVAKSDEKTETACVELDVYKRQLLILSSMFVVGYRRPRILFRVCLLYTSRCV